MREFILFLVLMMTIPVSACQAHEVGGKTSRDVFSDRGVRKLVDAACVGDKKTIEKLVKKGVDVNSEGLDNVTPLFWVLSCRNIEGLEALLAHGANPNHKIQWNRTPFTVAATYDDPRFFWRLLKAGGDVNAVTGYTEETVLMTAFRTGVDYNVWGQYYMLLDAGADINYITKDREYTLALFTGILFRRTCKTLELMDRGYSARLEDLLGYVERFPPSADSPDAKCQEPLIAAIKARIAEQQK